METQGLFFIIVPPGFELTAKKELEEKAPLYFPGYDFSFLSKVQVETGGIELHLPLSIGFSLNHILKIPTRILLRVESFKCRDFPKLFNKLKKLEWRQYLAGQMPAVDVTCHKSRLLNTNRIKETTQKAIAHYYKANPPKKIAEEELEKMHGIVYIRLDDNHCTISIDTSGDRLNIRGQRVLVGEAPIRETLAAAILYSLKDQIKSTTLIDPMCGAGTICLEAMDFYNANCSRNFAYQFFPLTKSLIIPELKLSVEPQWFKNYFGYDVSAKMVEVAQINTKGRIHCEKRDATQVHPSKELGGAVIFNPPYGQRLLPDHRLDKFYAQVIMALIESYSPSIIALIIPQSLSPHKIHVPVTYRLKEVMKFKNGGFAVRLIIYLPK